MKGLAKALAVLLTTVIVIAIVIGIAGHFVIVGLFGENGSVAKIGFTGYGDVFATLGAITAAPANVKSDDLASAQNDQKLYAELSTHTSTSIFTQAALNSSSMFDLTGVDTATLNDKEKTFVAFYGGVWSQSAPVTISGGMHAAGLKFLKEKGIASTDSDFDFDIKGISISAENNGERVIKLTLSLSKADLLDALPVDIDFIKSYIASKLHDELTISISCACNFVNGVATMGEASVSFNSASAADCKKIVNYINATTNGVIDSLPLLIEEFINAPIYTREPITGNSVRTANATFDSDGNIVYTKL
jgi:hypothetical protein